MKRITQYADIEWLRIEFGQDVLRGILRNWKKQQNPVKRITQFADIKWLRIEFGQDVLRGILRNWKQNDH